MDAIWLLILIITIVLLSFGFYLILECLEGHFMKDRTENSSPSNLYTIGNQFSIFSNEDDIEANKENEGTGPNPVCGLICQLHDGSKSLHARGLCNQAGGAWGTVTSVSGRAAMTDLWSPPSGGPFDVCQCEDNGGFH